MADFDPAIMLQLTVPQTPTPIARAVWRGRIRRQILDCTQCELHRHQPSDRPPVPYTAKSKTPAFVVVGEAPGPKESELGRPFIGPSGRLLRGLMVKVGIDPEGDVLWTNTVSCLPGPGDGSFRAPNSGELGFCRENMFDQIEAAYVPYVLLVGGTAFNSFRSDLMVSKHNGRLFVWNDMYAVMGTIHPAAALRKRSLKADIERDLETWGEVVYSGENPTRYLSRECVWCGSEMHLWDRDGVPFCKRHWDQWKHQWSKERLRWANAKIEQLAF